MFDSLADRLNGVFDGLRKRGALTEDDVSAAMRDIRIALLEADVALPVAKKFINSVKEKAIGQNVVKSVSPGQMVVKIIHDHLVELLGSEHVPLNLQTRPPVVILMAGLQGSGKTTSTGKLALRLKEKDGKSPLMASLDVYRPAAQQQLAVLGEQTGVASLPIVEGEKPAAITRRALDHAKRHGHDVIFLDTAGRLQIDENLMGELQEVANIAKPTEILLVADAMTGQDVVQVAEGFKNAVDLTGIILTRIDSDARGGAALSLVTTTGCPIKYVGTGEKLHELEDFHPGRIADRMLGMGDVATLVEKAAEQVDQKEAAKLAKKLQKGRFDLEDMLAQFKQMRKMGGIASLMGMLPGMKGLKDQLNSGEAEKAIKRQEAIIFSMTPQERRQPELLKASRKKRIAAGSGVPVSEINRLLKQFQQMQGMMKKFGKMGKKELLRGGLGKQLGAAGLDIPDDLGSLGADMPPELLGGGSPANQDPLNIGDLLKKFK